MPIEGSISLSQSAFGYQKFSDQRSRAACLFGPGGVFRSVWPIGSVVPAPPFDAALPLFAVAEGRGAAPGRRREAVASPTTWPSTIRSIWALADVLRSASDSAMKRFDWSRLPVFLLGPEGAFKPICAAAHGVTRAYGSKEKENASRHPTAKSDPDLHPRLSAGTWLFPDLAGDRRSSQHLKGHRLRAPQRARRARSGLSRSSQGSLFGAGRSS